MDLHNQHQQIHQQHVNQHMQQTHLQQMMQAQQTADQSANSGKSEDKKITYRPSKAQASMSLMMGIFVSLFGLFWTAIAPGFMKVFGIFFVAFAIGNTVASYRHAKGDADYMPEIRIEQANSPTQSAESRLESLRQLYEKRLITTQEYEQKKEEILKEL